MCLSAAALGRAIAMWNLSCVYPNDSNCSMLLKEQRAAYSKEKDGMTIDPME